MFWLYSKNSLLPFELSWVQAVDWHLHSCSGRGAVAKICYHGVFYCQLQVCSWNINLIHPDGPIAARTEWCWILFWIIDGRIEFTWTSGGVNFRHNFDSWRYNFHSRNNLLKMAFVGIGASNRSESSFVGVRSYNTCHHAPRHFSLTFLLPG